MDEALFPTLKAAVMHLIATMPPGAECDIWVHAPGCRESEVDLCTCEPKLLHHGHEAADCYPEAW